MKKQLCVLAIASLFSASALSSNNGLFVGVDYLSNSSDFTYAGGSTEAIDDSNNFSGYVAFEHFIPLIPNVKIRYSDLAVESESGEDFDSSLANGILYYQIFDNDLFQLDLGLAYTQAEIGTEDAAIAQAYGAAEFAIPGTGLYMFAEALGGSATDDDAMDASGGLGYTFNPDSFLSLSVRTGYRYQMIDIDKVAKQETSGFFAGVEASF
jgi:outer membrane protein